MDSTDRRQHRRLPLHLVVRQARLEGEREGPAWQTSNVSAGGMYVRVESAGAPQAGDAVQFVLSVPPGAGYSSGEGRIFGNGRVLRRDALSDQAAGLAVRFTNPLALDF